MRAYPKYLQIRVDQETRRQLHHIAKVHSRTMSDVVRLLIKCEASRTEPASLLAPCGGAVLADDAATGQGE